MRECGRLIVIHLQCWEGAVDLGPRWPFTGVSRPFGPETPKKSEESVPGACGPGSLKNLEKVSKKSRESGKRLEKVLNPGFPCLAFWGKARKTTQKNKDFSLCRTPKIPGKEGKNAQKERTFLATKKARKSKKARKGRSGKRHFAARLLPTFSGSQL